MSNHNLILEPFKGPQSRHTCPECGKKREFARYINTESGEYLADHVGRCNREVHCSYHYTPKQFFEDNPTERTVRPPNDFKPQRRPSPAPVRPVDLIPFEMLEKTMTGYQANYFFTFLQSLFTEDVARWLADTYCLGTSRHWPGANIFWQVDVKANLRQAKIMLYDPVTGRRVKDDGDKIYFAGKKLLSKQDANLQQCFFGEVLLTIYPQRKVAIVESEKTAIIASVYFPDIIWLATGGSHGCKWTEKDVCRVLARREVVMYPDLGFYDKWSEKADQVRQLVDCKIIVSDLLERHATEEQRKLGWDLADYLLMNRDSSGWALTAERYPLFWDVKYSA